MVADAFCIVSMGSGRQGFLLHMTCSQARERRKYLLLLLIFIIIFITITYYVYVLNWTYIVASIYYRGPHLESALTPSLRRRLCETSASLLMPISTCARTSNGLSPTASLFCGNFVASDDQFHHLCFRRWSMLSRLDYGNATPAEFHSGQSI